MQGTRMQGTRILYNAVNACLRYFVSDSTGFDATLLQDESNNRFLYEISSILVINGGTWQDETLAIFRLFLALQTPRMPKPAHSRPLSRTLPSTIHSHSHSADQALQSVAIICVWRCNIPG